MKNGKANVSATITIIAAIVGAIVGSILTASLSRLNDTNNRYGTEAVSMSEVFPAFPAQQDKFIADVTLTKGEISYCFEDVRDTVSSFICTTYKIKVKDDNGNVIKEDSHTLQPGNHRGAYYFVTTSKKNMKYKVSFTKKSSLDHCTNFDWLVLSE
jgi:hypothetical protein